MSDTKTNADELRELASACVSFDEFQRKAIAGVLRRMTIAEFEAEMEQQQTGDLQDYYENIKRGCNSADGSLSDEKRSEAWEQ